MFSEVYNTVQESCSIVNLHTKILLNLVYLHKIVAIVDFKSIYQIVLFNFGV